MAYLAILSHSMIDLHFILCTGALKFNYYDSKSVTIYRLGIYSARN